MSQTGQVAVLISQQSNTISDTHTHTQREARRVSERMLHLLDRPKYRGGRECCKDGVKVSRDRKGVLTIRYQQQEFSVALSPDKSNRLKRRSNILRVSKLLLANDFLQKSLSQQF